MNKKTLARIFLIVSLPALCGVVAYSLEGNIYYALKVAGVVLAFGFFIAAMVWAIDTLIEREIF